MRSICDGGILAREFGRIDLARRRIVEQLPRV